MTVRATWKKPRRMRDQYRENMTRSRTRSPLSFGSHNQQANRPVALSEPETMKANCHPLKWADKATPGTPTTDASIPTARSEPIARARLSGEITSEIAPTKVGGNVPAPKPVKILSTSSVSKLGANADPIRDPETSSNPARAMGRRPKESDNGPTEKTETPQAAKVAVANCPATATETSMSVDISTRRAVTIRFAFMAPKTATKRPARNSALFTSLELACIT